MGGGKSRFKDYVQQTKNDIFSSSFSVLRLLLCMRTIGNRIETVTAFHRKNKKTKNNPKYSLNNKLKKSHGCFTCVEILSTSF